MAVRERWLERVSQPQEAAGINWSHPLAGGLVVLVNAADEKNVAGLSLGSTAGPPQSDSGLVYRAITSSNQWTIPVSHSGDEWGLVLVFRSVSDGILLRAGDLALQIYNSFGDQRLELDKYFVTAIFDTSFGGGTGTWGQWRTLVLTYNESTGAAKFTTSDGYTYSTTNAQSLADGDITLGWSASADVALFGCGNRAWDDDERAQIAANPWQLLEPERIWVPVSAGGGPSTYEVSIIESVSAADAFTAASVLASALSEAASASDVVAAAAEYQSTLSEAASATDAVSGSLTVAGTLSEAASALDALSSAASLSDSLSESVSTSDEIDGGVAANTYSAELAEAASASDSWSLAAVLAAQLVEAVTAQDAQAASAVFVAVLSEAAAAADAMSAVGVFADAISEAVSAADVWSEASNNVYAVALAEAVAALDIWSSSGISGAPGVRGRQVARDVVRRLSMAGPARGRRI